jgi:hypothetical protein
MPSKPLSEAVLLKIFAVDAVSRQYLIQLYHIVNFGDAEGQRSYPRG